MPLLERVFGQYGIPVAIGRRVPFTHTTIGRALAALARCAWLAGRLGCGAAQRTCARRAWPPTPEVVDGLELDVRREAVGTAEEARGRLGWALAEIDSLRAASAPSVELAWQARRLFAAPSPGRAPQLSRGRGARRHRPGDAAASARRARRAGRASRRRGADRAARGARGRAARRLPPRRGADRRSARDQGPAVPGRVRVRTPGGPVPAAGDARAVPRRRAPVGAGRRVRAGAALERGSRSTASATCSTRVSRGPPSSSFSATGAPTRRATSSCPRRSLPTSPTCSSRGGRTGASDGCSPTSSGSPRRRPRRASSRGPRPRRARRRPASRRCRRRC